MLFQPFVRWNTIAVRQGMYALKPTPLSMTASV